MATVIKRETLKTINNIPDWSLKTQKNKDKDAKPRPLRTSSKPKAPTSKPATAPKPAPQPTREAVKEVAKEEVKDEAKERTERILRVRRIYSREFLIKFKYSSPTFPPGAVTPADLIAQYNKDFEQREREYALRIQQETASLATSATPVSQENVTPVTDASTTSAPKEAVATKESRRSATGPSEKRIKKGEGKGEKNGEKAFKLRLNLAGADDAIMRSPMFRGSSSSSSAPSKPAKVSTKRTLPPAAEVIDKENGGTNLPPAAPSKALRSASSSKRRPSPSPVPPKETKVKKAKEPEASTTTPILSAPAAVPATTPAPLTTPSVAPAAPQVETPPVEINAEMKDVSPKEDAAMDGLTKQLKTVMREADPRRLAQRQKQIDYGKATPGYSAYVGLVAKSKRKREDPKTPNKNQVCSKRSWDGQIRKWRRMLHFYDPPELKASLQGKDDDLDLDLGGGDDEEVEITDAEIAAEAHALAQ